ncbi:TonB family protein [Candidatus Fukatsuia symbiotica]|nr:TonB family protein [Candidatus Fukatsuia symbiotica]MEA9444230.1 TonB family protein [Candidatus Fukatsuia symbiotica]
MQQIKIFPDHRIIWPAILSTVLHVSLITALLYVSVQDMPIFPDITEVPSAVTRVNISTFAPVPQSLSVTQAVVGKSQSQSLKATIPKMTQAKPLVNDPLVKSARSKVISKNAAAKSVPTASTLKNLTTVSENTTAISKHSATASGNSETVSGDPTTIKPKALSRAKPVYPARAWAAGIEGEVKVRYDVDENGLVINVKVLQATPRNIFEREVKKVMKKWRYESIAFKGYVMVIKFKINGLSMATEVSTR